MSVNDLDAMCVRGGGGAGMQYVCACVCVCVWQQGWKGVSAVILTRRTCSSHGQELLLHVNKM